MARREIKTKKNEEVIEDDINNTVEEEAKAPVTGVVFNCEKLNVRSKPSTNAKPLTVIASKESVTINIDDSNHEWYKVTTSNNIEGYCMKKFIAID